MAEVKSALEIAMERAAALGSGEDDSKRQAREKGRALARQRLDGDLPATDMAAQLGELDAQARTAAAEALLEALGEDRAGALPALEALASRGGSQPAYGRVAQAQEQREQARQALEKELAGEMAGELAAKGIGGGAVSPNPAAHPDYQARCAVALARAEAELKAAGQKLLQGLI